MQSFRRLTGWLFAIAAIAALDLLASDLWGLVVLQLTLLPLIWKFSHRRFVTRLTIIQVITVATVGLVKFLVPTTVANAADMPQFIITPVRLWVLVTLFSAGYFHLYLQGRLRNRLENQRHLQRRVQRRSNQIRQVNEALRVAIARREETEDLLDRSEMTWRTVTDKMQLQVARKNTEGVFTYANESFCRLRGLPVAEVIGRTDMDLFDADLASTYRADDLQVMATGTAKDQIEEHPLEDGTTGYAQVFKAPEYDKQGECIGVRVIFFDVTARHQNEIKLRDSEARKRALFDAAGDAVILVDHEGMILEANPSSIELLSDLGSELVGRRIDSLISPYPDGNPELQNQPTDVTTWNSLPLTARHQLHLRRNDGHSFDSETSRHVIPIGSDVGHAIIIRDITLQQQVLSAEREAKAAAEQANQTKTQFMASISHELRTPLGGIRGLADLLGKLHLSSEARKYVGLIAQNTEFLSDVIEDILDFAAIESGRVAIAPAKTNLHEVVGDAMACLAIRVADKPVRLALSIDPSTPRHVKTDAKRLRQIVVNLVGNAIKFTQRGEVSLRVSVGPATTEDPNDCNILITVRDSGIGIAAENVQRIFDAFEQADHGTNKQFGGTGLGLAITRGLCERMGGGIEVESEPNVGSMFRCRIVVGKFGQQTLSGMPPTITKADRGAVVIAVGNDIVHNAIAEVVRADGWAVRDVKHVDATTDGGPPQTVRWIVTASGADAAWRIRARKRREPVMWLTHAGSAPPRRALMHDAVMIEPVIPDELRDWLKRTPPAPSSPSQLQGKPTPVDPNPKPTENETQFFGLDGVGSLVVPSGVPKKSFRDPTWDLLVVDDSATNRLVIHDQLTSEGHRVWTAQSGSEAIAIIQNQRFDCVLMDLQMPEMDGTETTERVLAWASTTGRWIPPIIALTAHATEQHRLLCRQAGMSGYVTKPVEVRYLVDEIERVVQANRATDGSSDLGWSSVAPHRSVTGHRPSASETIVASTNGSVLDEAREANSGASPWMEQISRHCGDDPATIRSVCDAFLSEVPRLLVSLQGAAKRGDSRTLKRSSHTLKSCLRYVAPKDDVDVAANFEKSVGDEAWLSRLKEQSNSESGSGDLRQLQSVVARWQTRVQSVRDGIRS
ncbi:MAG: ATP-binding protein [Planctomycetota bacterium]